MKLKEKKIAVFVENFYEDLEFWYPYLRMKEEGADVTIIAPENNKYKGKKGLTVEPDLTIKEANYNDYDALIIPGGYAPDHMRRVPEMVEFVKKMFETKKIIASICHAPWMLASAGIIKGKNLTSYFSIKDDLINAGANWKDEEVVIDENLITSRNPKDLPTFCRSIIENIK